jgi:hypothetical protein
MVVELLDPATLGRLVVLTVLLVIAAAYGYSRGHKEGSREGYIRGRSVVRHVSALNKGVK